MKKSHSSPEASSSRTISGLGIFLKMVGHSPLTVGLTVCLTAGCLPKSKEATLTNDLQGGEQTISKPRIVFNWSRDTGSLYEHLMTQAGDARNKNRDLKTADDRPLLGTQGYGLYVTMDPFVSLSFGSELTCLSLNPRANWVDNDLVPGEPALANLRGPSDLIVYGWGTSFLDGQKKTAISGVIRNPRMVDLNLSGKFSMAEFGGGDGLGSVKIAKARQRLQSGNWCQALSTYENEYGTFAMSFLSAFSFGASKERYRHALGAIWQTLPGDLSENLTMARGIDRIEKNSLLIRELNEAGIIVGKDAESRKKDFKSLISKALVYPAALIPGDFPESQIPARMALLTRLFSETGLFPMVGQSNSVADFTAAFHEACYQLVSQWGEAHPQDVGLAKEFIAIMLKNGLAGMSNQRTWPE